ncbi:MAG: CapA family protein [Anaerolineales bacterium]
MSLHTPYKYLSLLLAAVLLLVGCGAPDSTPNLPPKATPSPTHFQVDEPTATPAAISAWRSPALPPELAESAEALQELNGQRIEWVDRAEAAELRFEPAAQQPLSVWVYAAAVPFATVTDGLSLEDLSSSFSGTGPRPMVAEHSTLQAWASRWGQPGVEAQLPEQWFDSAAKEDVEAVALLEFDQLGRQWKVLRVEDQSPFDPDFNASSYPLTVTFGVSGPSELQQAAAQAVDWPPTNRDDQQLTSLAITGVTALTRATAWAIQRQGVDWAVESVAPVLSSADITHISHEVSFTPACPPVNPSRDVMRFCAQPEQIEVLAAIGTDVVELTGNHVMDYGSEALLTTLDLYQQQEWAVFGGGRNLMEAEEPAILEHNGHRFAFLGCNSAGPNFAWATSEQPGARPCDFEVFYQQIRDLKDKGYLPVVTFQWAESYRDWPLPQQAEAFRQAAAAGAVIVSGSQAHRPQGFEFTDQGFIHFGLGNLFFDQMWSLETRQEFIDLYHFYQGELISIELTTWMLDDYARVRPMTEEERAGFLEAMFETSGY